MKTTLQAKPAQSNGRKGIINGDVVLLHWIERKEFVVAFRPYDSIEWISGEYYKNLTDAIEAFNKREN